MSEVTQLHKLATDFGRLALEAQNNAAIYRDDTLNRDIHVKEFWRYQAFAQAHGMVKDAINELRGYK